MFGERKSMKKKLSGRVFSLLLLALLLCGSLATAAPVSAEDGACGYVNGFALLRDLIALSEKADQVGACQEREYHAPNGDGVQWTSNGVLLWRKTDNWTAFTDGQSTWVNGPQGLQKRANSERFPWEPKPLDAVQLLLAPPKALPTAIEVDEAVRQVLVLHQANDGSTFNLTFGDLGGAALYAVSLYPERSVVVEGKQIPLAVLRRFVVDNLDILRDPRVSIGTWFNSDDGMSYLDISATLPDKAQAIELGKKYNQIAIFDLATFEEIPTGGTGTQVPNLPAPDQRLPQWAK